MILRHSGEASGFLRREVPRSLIDRSSSTAGSAASANPSPVVFECRSRGEERLVYKKLNSTELLIQRTTREASKANMYYMGANIAAGETGK